MNWRTQFCSAGRLFQQINEFQPNFSQVPLLDINPRSKLTKQYRGLAEAIREELSVSADQVSARDGKKLGFFKRWLSLRSAS